MGSHTGGSGGKWSGAVYCVFGAVFCILPAIFIGLGLYGFWQGIRQSTWDEVPCTIERFEIHADQTQYPAFQPDVAFHYVRDGKSFTGKRLWASGEKGEAEYEKLAGIQETLRNKTGSASLKGAATTCHVNPARPDDAALLPPDKSYWVGLGIAAIGCCFMAVGIGMIAYGRRVFGGTPSEAGHDRSAIGLMVEIPSFSVFAIVGFGILFFGVIPKVRESFTVKSWQATQATVIWSSAIAIPQIFYRYQFQGREYRSGRYSLVDGRSKNLSDSQALVDAYKPGSNITCYVNPVNPWQAMIRRDAGWEALFAFIPLPFIAFGVGGLWRTLRKQRMRRGR